MAFTVQINCGSGMQSIDTAYRTIEAGKADMSLAGGAGSIELRAAGVSAIRRALVRKTRDRQGYIAQKLRRS